MLCFVPPGLQGCGSGTRRLSQTNSQRESRLLSVATYVYVGVFLLVVLLAACCVCVYVWLLRNVGKMLCMGCSCG